MAQRTAWTRWLMVGTSLAWLACSASESSPNPPSGSGGNAGGAAAGAPSAGFGPAGSAGLSAGGASNGGTGVAGSGVAGSAGAGFAGSGGVGVAGAGGGLGGLGGAPSAGAGGTSTGGGGTTSTGGGGTTSTGGGGTTSTGGGGTTSTGGAGAAGAPFSPSFVLGADISSVQESNRTYRDTDGQTKSIFNLLKNHGFNYARVKAFVDPSAPYGYSSTANGCPGMPQAYGDKAHVVAFGQQIKQAGMGFLLDFHYSDVWADPGNQIIPQAWRNAGSIAALAALLKAYTKDVITTAVNAGARPDMVQIGNEITPGMLMHVPGPSTDCYGNNPVAAPSAISGSTANWNNLATLLIAGIEGVREVDPRIQILLHVENTDDLAGVRWWVDNAIQRNVRFDVLGLSCYTAYQGPPSTWQATFTDLANRYPTLKFAIAEYNPERTQANLIIKNLPNGRGLGTFFWEPTRSGDWGAAMFGFQGNTATANNADFAEYDALRPQLGL